MLRPSRSIAGERAIDESGLFRALNDISRQDVVGQAEFIACALFADRSGDR